MNIVFPDNPSTNDTVSFGSITWKWNGSDWVIDSMSVSANGMYFYSDTEPASPTLGDKWYNTLSKIEYTYVYNSTLGINQWVTPSGESFIGPLTPGTAIAMAMIFGG